MVSFTNVQVDNLIMINNTCKLMPYIICLILVDKNKNGHTFIKGAQPINTTQQFNRLYFEGNNINSNSSEYLENSYSFYYQCFNKIKH